MMEMDPILLGEILAGTLFFGIIFVLALGFPVAYTLAGTSLMIAAVGWYFEVFDFSNFGALASRYVGFMSSEVLVAVPVAPASGALFSPAQASRRLLAAPMTAPAAARAAASSTPGAMSAAAMARSVSCPAVRTAAASDGVRAASRMRS